MPPAPTAVLGIEPPEDTGGGWVVCVDLDTPEAVAIAEHILPLTGEIGGRSDSRRSHWFYQCDPPPATTRYTAPDGTRLLEVLSTGTQVLVPPSVHPSGQRYEWTTRLERPSCGPPRLLKACAALAGATLLARHWPQPGSRRQASLALAGVLLASGWTLDSTEGLMRAVAIGAHDEELSKRIRTGASTLERQMRGAATSGWPALARIFSEEVLDRFRSWLGLRPTVAVLSTFEPPLEASRPLEGAPGPFAPAAYHGLAGDIVRTIAPHTEADPAALLFQLLTAFGNSVGSGPCFRVEATLHRANLFCVLVGASSKARKGTSWKINSHYTCCEIRPCGVSSSSAIRSTSACRRSTTTN